MLRWPALRVAFYRPGARVRIGAPAQHQTTHLLGVERKRLVEPLSSVVKKARFHQIPYPKLPEDPGHLPSTAATLLGWVI